MHVPPPTILPSLVLVLALALASLPTLTSCSGDAQREAERREADRAAMERERADLVEKLKEAEQQLSELPHTPPVVDDERRRELQRKLAEEEAAQAARRGSAAPSARPAPSPGTPSSAKSGDPFAERF